MSLKPFRTLRHNSRIKVMVVDDSVVIRNLVSMALQSDPSLEVVGTAPNGEIGLKKIPQLNPDVITLDIEMPGMDGLEMLRHVRAEYPDIFIIMFSTLTGVGAAATLDALMHGANDYVLKPANCGSLDQSMLVLRNELIPKIKQFYRVEDSSPEEPVTVVAREARATSAVRHDHREPQVVAIGVSTGGPTALATMMPMFPADFAYPVVIVQHMPPVFTKLLAERLQKLTPLGVEEATSGCKLQAGKIFIAPGDFHMKVKRIGQSFCVVTDQSTPQNSCRPSVDVLFDSVEEAYGGNVVAVILTGMGKDGLRGTELLKSSGAYVVAQDEPSSVVWGMPGFVVKAGLADTVVPITEIVPTVVNQFRGAGRTFENAGRIS